eukprot:GDKK01003242.1.p1 GENE.GDKK01003242.1~~GDKK01003242.1.p1  ORF type:complete len:229 (-),score=46.75 GDKK01003242.1:47-733(-)
MGIGYRPPNSMGPRYDWGSDGVRRGRRFEGAGYGGRFEGGGGWRRLQETAAPEENEDELDKYLAKWFASSSAPPPPGEDGGDERERRRLQQPGAYGAGQPPPVAYGVRTGPNSRGWSPERIPANGGSRGGSVSGGVNLGGASANFNANLNANMGTMGGNMGGSINRNPSVGFNQNTNLNANLNGNLMNGYNAGGLPSAFGVYDGRAYAGYPGGGAVAVGVAPAAGRYY